MQNMNIMPFSICYPTLYYPLTYYLQPPMFLPYNWFDHQTTLFRNGESMVCEPFNCFTDIKQIPTNNIQLQPIQSPNSFYPSSLLATQNGPLLQEYSKRNQILEAKQQRQIIRKGDKTGQKIVNKSRVERFIKKNTESNIVNQIFSFLCHKQKSQIYLKKILKNPQQQLLYYTIFNKIKIHYKKQLNRFYLKTLLNLINEQSLYKKLKNKIKELNVLDVQKFSKTVTKLAYFYLREDNRLYILTSKKMNNQLWGLHLQKSRQMRQFLFEQTMNYK